MEEAGLVVRRPHPTDKRQIMVELTPRADELIQANRRRRDEWLQTKLKQLTHEERDILRKAAPVLERLAASMSPTFRAFKVRNFRLYASGAIVSNVGTWMQRVAQDWLVLELTHSGTPLGIVTGLQFLPALLLAPYAGLVADRFPKRLVLTCTQIAMASRRPGARWSDDRRCGPALARLPAGPAVRRGHRLRRARPGSPSSSRWSAARSCPTRSA